MSEWWEKYKRGRLVHHKEQEEARIRDAVAQVPKKWRDQFREFLNTGEASKKFLKWLNKHDEYLKLCDEVFDADGLMNDLFGPNGLMEGENLFGE